MVGTEAREHGGGVTPSFLGMEYIGQLRDAGIKIKVGLL